MASLPCLRGWSTEWVVLVHGIEIAIAGWALWVIVSAQRRPVESVG